MQEKISKILLVPHNQPTITKCVSLEYNCLYKKKYTQGKFIRKPYCLDKIGSLRLSAFSLAYQIKILRHSQ